MMTYPYYLSHWKTSKDVVADVSITYVVRNEPVQDEEGNFITYDMDKGWPIHLYDSVTHSAIDGKQSVSYHFFRIFTFYVGKHWPWVKLVCWSLTEFLRIGVIADQLLPPSATCNVRKIWNLWKYIIWFIIWRWTSRWFQKCIIQ